MTSHAEARAALLSFYDAHKRDLPWRRARDAYATWVSEIMLQQTRVDTVVPYFGAFMRRFPTVLALADASADEVLSAWSGLGYYRRARMLHEGAKKVAREHGGKIPPTAEALRELPGVGRYTAGAIASIAFGEEAPLVDGNVVRVLARAFGIDRELSPQDPELWQIAGALVRGDRPGDLNQALMELGATVCTKDAPACDACPLAAQCVARAEDKTRVWPRLPAKRAAKKVAMLALVAERDGTLLLAQRREEGLFGGLWEPPMVSRDAQSDEPRALFAELLGCAVTLTAGAGQVRHVLTHRELRVDVHRGTLKREPRVSAAGPYVAARYVHMGELERLGVSKLARKVLDAAPSAKKKQGMAKLR